MLQMHKMARKLVTSTECKLYLSRKCTNFSRRYFVAFYCCPFIESLTSGDFAPKLFFILFCCHVNIVQNPISTKTCTEPIVKVHHGTMERFSFLIFFHNSLIQGAQARGRGRKQLKGLRAKEENQRMVKKKGREGRKEMKRKGRK